MRRVSANSKWLFGMFVAATMWLSGVALAENRATEPRLVLKGYDPVAYFSDGKPTKGNPAISYVWDEGRYYFANAKNKELFVANSDRYAPQFAGFCTGGVLDGVKEDSNPEYWLILNGRLYTFYSARSRDAALGDPTLFSRAAQTWQKIK